MQKIEHQNNYRIPTGFDIINVSFTPKFLFTTFFHKPSLSGIATGGSCLQGIALTMQAIESWRRAQKNDDKEGMQEAAITLGMGASFIGGGALYIGSHATELASEVRRVKTAVQTTQLAKASSLLNVAGNFLFLLSNLAFLVLATWKWWQTVKLSKKLEAKPEALCDFFFNQKNLSLISRATNNECVEAIEKAKNRGLKERLFCSIDVVKKAAQAELNTLKDKITQVNAGQGKMRAVIAVVTGVATVIFATAIIFSLFATLPFGAVVGLFGTLALIFLAASILDAYSLRTSTELPGSNDKKYHIAFVCVTVILLAISCGLTLGFGFSLLPLILSLILGTTAITVSGLSWKKLKHNEEVYKINHPDLETFKTAFQATKDKGGSWVDLKIQRLFKQLPKDEKQKIREKYIETLKGDFKNLLEKGPINTDDFLLLEKSLKQMLKRHWEEVDTKDALEIQEVFDSLQNNVWKKLSTKLEKELLQEISYLDKRFKDKNIFEQVLNGL